MTTCRVFQSASTSCTRRIGLTSYTSSCGNSRRTSWRPPRSRVTTAKTWRTLIASGRSAGRCCTLSPSSPRSVSERERACAKLVVISRSNTEPNPELQDHPLSAVSWYRNIVQRSLWPKEIQKMVYIRPGSVLLLSVCL